MELLEAKFSSASIPHLKDYEPDDIFRILSRPIVAVEKLNGVKFTIIKTKDGKVQYWSKNNKLDKAMRIVGKWDVLISRLETLREKTNNFEKLPNDSEISGEFFSSSTDNTEEYDDVPRGNFVISFAKVKGKEYTSSEVKELQKWSEYFESGKQTVMFSGKLSNDQIIKLKIILQRKDKNFLNDSINIIDPEYSKEIEGIVIYSDSTVAKIVDPVLTTTNNPQRGEDQKETAEFKKDLMRFVLLYITPRTIDSVKQSYADKLAKLKHTEDKYLFTIDKLFLLTLHYPEFKALEKKFKDFKFQSSELTDTHIQQRVKDAIKKSAVAKEFYQLILIIFRKEHKQHKDIFKDVDLDKFNSLVKVMR